MKRCWFPASKGTAQFIRPGIDGFWRERPLSGVKANADDSFVCRTSDGFHISILSFLHIFFPLTSGR